MNPLKLLPFEKIADKLCDSAQTQLKEQQDRIREGEMPPGVDPRRGLTKDEVKATLREEARQEAREAERELRARAQAAQDAAVDAQRVLEDRDR